MVSNDYPPFLSDHADIRNRNVVPLEVSTRLYRQRIIGYSINQLHGIDFSKKETGKTAHPFLDLICD